MRIMNSSKPTFNFLKISALCFFLSTCTPSGQPNLFTVQDDINLGKQVRDEIAANPTEYPILSESQYPVAYQRLRNIRDKILNSGKLDYKDRFAWEVYIIRDDNTLNAFATPGGYIYVYTGLIKYLDNEDQLAGVMGHEIAHADRRHSTTNLTKIYGVSLLLNIVLGQNNTQLKDIVKQISGNLAGLAFSRDTEKDADDQSVIYLSATEYQCTGAAGFFEKIKNEGKCNQVVKWASTHPDPCDRILNIQQKGQSLGCKLSLSTADYQAFKNSLP